MRYTALYRFGVIAVMLTGWPAGSGAQVVTCVLSGSQDGGGYSGRCATGTGPYAEIDLGTARSSPHVWAGSATLADGRSTEFSVDTRPKGTVRLGRAWLARETISVEPGTLTFSFRLDTPAPAGDVDFAILQAARSYLSDANRWNPSDSTNMGLAPTRGFSWCIPGARQSMFCELYFASLEIAGDYAHFRPAINAVRQSISSGGAPYSHPLIDFNNDPSRALADILSTLDSALAIARSDGSKATRAALHDGPDCDRECLRLFLDQYLEALAAHDPARLPLAENFRLTENGAESAVGEGFWTTAGAMGPNRTYVLDPEAGQAAVQGVAREEDKDVVLMVRVRVVGRQILEAETLVVRETDTNFFAPRAVPTLPPLDYPVPPPRRQTREALIALADGYFTALHTSGTPDYRPVALATSANRYENGVLTTNVTTAPAGSIVRLSAAEQFDRGVFAGRNVVDRRYPVVDVETGLVLGIAAFRPSPSERILLISEVFRAKGGQLEDIRAVMLNRPAGAPTGW